MKTLKFLILSSYLSFAFACTNEDVKLIKVDKRVLSKDTSESKVINNIVYFDIQPYDGLQDEMIDYIVSELKKTHTNVKLLPSVSLPRRAYYKPRNRYKADTLIKLQSEKALAGHVIVGLTHKDISSDNGSEIPDWGIMGLGYQPGNACVASIFRVSKTNTKEQYFKVVIHEIGHTQGLSHCPNKTCIMTDAEGKNNTNYEKGFCKVCRLVMENKGFELEKIGM